jgi:AraC-like DNA-binding protein
MATLIDTRYRGDFVAWPGVAGFMGDGGGGAPIQPHAHYAIQLVLGLPAGVRVQCGRHGAWQSCAGALLPSRVVHSIDVSGCEMSAVLFIEPETPHGRALAARMQGEMCVLDGDVITAAAQRLQSAWRVEQSMEAVQAVCMALLQALSGAAPRAPSDPRVLAAVDYIGARVSETVTLPDVARAVHLSAERFRHLFVQETGMPLRTYVLWRRLLLVWTLLMQGETLSGAAHAAGFADSAHLSRTARSMFGLPPSVLQMRGPLSRLAQEQRQLR